MRDHFFLGLIPKVDHQSCLSEYKPISLIGSIYKFISKLLALRLKRVLGVVRSNCQTAFLPKRHILDGVIVKNELVGLARKIPLRNCVSLGVETRDPLSPILFLIVVDGLLGVIRPFNYAVSYDIVIVGQPRGINCGFELVSGLKHQYYCIIGSDASRSNFLAVP
ncbi:hypothetical protein CR513_49710, partial [Mucuna pruriens]